jgi:hypothetical protein
MGLSPTHAMVETPSREFYREAMEFLSRARLPFLVGGAFAFVHQAGIDRSTKDLDIFVRPSDVHLLLGVCAAAGYEADLVYSHWLAKIKSPTGFIDVIFSSGNGIATVDDEWFEHARDEQVLGLTMPVCPPEETIWSKAFVMERSRFDGADVAHLLLARADSLDWERLVRRFGANWRVLLAHLVLFGFIFPTERHRIPRAVVDGLLARLAEESAGPAPADKVCRGTLLSWHEYLIDLEYGGFRDARLQPDGPLTPRQVELWTERPK